MVDQMLQLQDSQPQGGDTLALLAMEGLSHIDKSPRISASASSHPYQPVVTTPGKGPTPTLPFGGPANYGTSSSFLVDTLEKLATAMTEQTAATNALLQRLLDRDV